MDEAGEGTKVDLAGAVRLYIHLAVFKNDKDALPQVIRLKNEMSIKEWNDLKRRETWIVWPGQPPVVSYSQWDPRILKPDEVRTLAQIDEAGEGAKVDSVGAAVLYAALGLNNDKDALQQVARLKKGMSARDWSEVQKRLTRYQLDPQKLAALLQQSASASP